MDLLRFRPSLLHPMQRKLKRHLLVRPHAVKERYGSAERLEIYEMNGVFQSRKELGKRLLLDMRLAADRGLPLNLLIFRQLEAIGNIPQTRDTLSQQAEPLFCAASQVENTLLRQKAPTHIMQRTGVRIVTARSELNDWMLRLAERA